MDRPRGQRSRGENRHGEHGGGEHGHTGNGHSGVSLLDGEVAVEALQEVLPNLTVTESRCDLSDLIAVWLQSGLQAVGVGEKAGDLPGGIRFETCCDERGNEESVDGLRDRRISLWHKAGLSWAEIGDSIGQRSRMVTADTYSFVIADYREVDYQTVLQGASEAGHARMVLPR